ncbi:helix-turn-helix domain-containing protein [Vibrio sp. SCSIO 43135]|uniref:helix-turn-helix domain-containing protein n=1 Tax=Vibrio sp. SCSIO 43135 TaxID=2819096 RepID=UPI002074CE88|nr:helix-turn-helix domain-containing protein [Vibrio sp. SCSIO 43135]USD43181.1 helix-turn-helix domain-containing protein [Vibrio sp. SCSIO 43135]
MSVGLSRRYTNKVITWKRQLEPIKHLVDWVWYLKVEQDEPIDHPPQLIPNVNAHYIISPPEQRFCYYTPSLQYQGKGTHLLTPNTHTLTLDDSAPLTRLGLRLTPTALYRLGLNEAGQLNQCRQDSWLDGLFRFKDYQALLIKGDESNILQQVAKDLAPLLDKETSDSAAQLADKAVTAIELSQGMQTSEQLALKCHTTKRTLERAFSKVIGMSIKQYQTIVKCEALFMHLYQHPNETDWATLAQQFGFSDQPHLIRQVKKLLGVTPGKYLSIRDLVIDVYGDFE